MHNQAVRLAYLNDPYEKKFSYQDLIQNFTGYPHDKKKVFRTGSQKHDKKNNICRKQMFHKLIFRVYVLNNILEVIVS